jgi:hypothetical protein
LNSALIVGHGMRPGLALARWLERQGWNSHFESSAENAFRVLKSVPYDLILASMKIEPQLRCQLVGLSLDVGSTLFFSLAVEYGCWWLPAVRMGEHCVRPAAFHSNKLAENILIVSEELDWKGTPTTSRADGGQGWLPMRSNCKGPLGPTCAVTPQAPGHGRPSSSEVVLTAAGKAVP